MAHILKTMNLLESIIAFCLIMLMVLKSYIYVIFRNDNVIDTVFVPDGTTFGMFPAKCEKCKLLSYDIHIDNCVEK